MVICSAWLLVHRLFNLYCIVFIISLSRKITTPAPTPNSLLLTSVYASNGFKLSSSLSIVLVCVAGWAQISGSLSLLYCVPKPRVISHSLPISSIFIWIGVTQFVTHSIFQH
jgi:hypothetical protein